MKRNRTTLLAVLLGAAMALPAAGDGAELSTRDITWGEYWGGGKVKSAKDLKGKVVLLKIWGG